MKKYLVILAGYVVCVIIFLLTYISITGHEFDSKLMIFSIIASFGFLIAWLYILKFKNDK